MDRGLSLSNYFFTKLIAFREVTNYRLCYRAPLDRLKVCLEEVEFYEALTDD